MFFESLCIITSNSSQKYSYDFEHRIYIMFTIITITLNACCATIIIVYNVVCHRIRTVDCVFNSSGPTKSKCLT